MSSVLSLIKSFVQQKLQLQSKKKQVQDKVLEVSEGLIVNHVLPTVSGIVRKLIVKKGLNPDYVPPPPAPQPTLKDVFTAKENYYKPHEPAWVAESFKNPSKHPVLVSRAKLRQIGLKDSSLEKAKEEVGLQVALAPEVTEIGADAINNLRDFMKDFDVLLASEKPAKKTRKVAAKKVAKSKASKKPVVTKVAKHFGGNFRRISEE